MGYFCGDLEEAEELISPSFSPFFEASPDSGTMSMSLSERPEKFPKAEALGSDGFS